mmetsp:Transcript_27442/g.74248  ORF Transcript_27442/g.74248 Transcript_27442/m.74248 type:complete len:85 (-) Transcript_27442:1677-1931(-)
MTRRTDLNGERSARPKTKLATKEQELQANVKKEKKRKDMQLAVQLEGLREGPKILPVPPKLPRNKTNDSTRHLGHDSPCMALDI